MATRKILVTSNKKKHLIALSDIVLVKALNIHARIYLSSGGEIEVSETISSIEQQINSKAFFRSHRSFLLNLHFISYYSKMKKQVVLHPYELALPVARDKIKDFELRLKVELLEM